jgi:hypothetical protein
MLVKGDEKAVGAVQLVHLFVQRILAVTKDNVGEVLELTGCMSAIPAPEFESQKVHSQHASTSAKAQPHL